MTKQVKTNLVQTERKKNNQKSKAKKSN